MTYFDYANYNKIPLGEEGLIARMRNSIQSVLNGNKSDSEGWDRQANKVTINGKTYSTTNREDVVALQDYLISKGYNLGVAKGTGNFGKNTQAALTSHFSSKGPVTTQSSTQPIPKTDPAFFTNMAKTVKGWFDKERTQNSWDQSTGVVTIDGKNYSTNNRDDVAALQDYLIDKGYNLGVTSGNGNFGKNTRAALTSFMSNNTTTNTGSGQGDPNKVVKITANDAKDLYQNGSGYWDAGVALMKHIILPQDTSLTHSTKTKQQAAALIGYTGGKSGNLGYGDIGSVNGWSKNPNEQPVGNNGYGKIIGGATVKKDGENYVISDDYDFHTIRDFNTKKTDAKGNIRPLASERHYTYDPTSSTRTAWQGLKEDLSGDHTWEYFKQNPLQTTQWLAENFATRQGKSRRSEIALTAAEINKMNNKA